MNKDVFEEMIKGLKSVEVVVDAITSRGMGYSSINIRFVTFTENIICKEKYVIFCNVVPFLLDTAPSDYKRVMIPYERIVCVCS